jgi:signal transduction histidine kinase
MGKSEIIITIILFNLIFIAFISAIVVYIRQYRIKKKEHNTMLQTQLEIHQKELLSTQLEIQLQTMQHIGREIHDNVGQKLTLASLYTQQLAFENKAPLVKESIENVSKIINESLSELRELSRSLTDNSIETNTIYQLISQEVKKIKDLNLCSITFECNQKHNDLAYTQKAILFRIVQEFLQNSMKHAQCQSIAIQLNFNLDNVQLLIEDDGKGFDASKINTTGIGLANMQKRTEMIGGTFVLESNLNKGTQLTVILPIIE